MIGMPQHRLNLCEEHYDAWVLKTVQRAIDEHRMFTREERVLVAVSGGKDSLALWDILERLGYQTEGVYIHLGIAHEGYSDVSQATVETFAAQHGLSCQVVNVGALYGRTIPELRSTGRGKHTCAVCGLVKRHVMNRVAWEGGYAAIATGHQVDDEAAILLQNTLHWQSG
ncbi:MAG: adenine nucleotide alpha hydrolase family protein, partial [Chloroflexi bacterium]|nr:adenine nucleotide alpha hydrolase family protein [Chloroflexota bacterium]